MYFILWQWPCAWLHPVTDLLFRQQEAREAAAAEAHEKPMVSVEVELITVMDVFKGRVKVTNKNIYFHDHGVREDGAIFIVFRNNSNNY